MTPPNTSLDAKSLLILGALIALITAAVQGLILYSNIAFTYRYFGLVVTAIYIAAATCYILLPWICEQVEEFADAKLTRYAIFAFCFWISAEEAMHAASHFHAPEGTLAIASVFFPEVTAKNIAILITVAVSLLIVEALTHLHHKACGLVRENYRKRK